MDNQRFILVVVFSFSLVMLWDAWQKHNHPKLPAQQTTNEVKGGVPLPTPTTKLARAKPVAPEGASTRDQALENVVNIKTDLFTAGISTLGGDIVSLELNNYNAPGSKEKKFFLFDPKHQYVAQSGLIGEGLPNHKTVFSVVSAARELAPEAQTVQLRLEGPSVSGVKTAKVYTFTRGSYLINVSHEITNGSQQEIAGHAYYQLQRDSVTPDGENSMVSTFTGPAVYTEQDHYQKIDFKDIEKGKAKFSQKADNGWLAMVQHYFVSAWIPQENVPREFYTNKLDGGENSVAAVGVIVPVPPVAPGAKVSQSVSLYAGPQIQSVLEQLGKPAGEGGVGAKELARVVDYGLLTIVAAPIFWCLEALHKIVGNWGWAIVLLTIGIKLIFFPLSAASYKSMAKMRAVMPRVNALRERCGDDKRKLNEEMMKLYKSENINPLGGCLPIVIQIPVFIALYWALLGAVEMRDAPWVLWIHDLSSQDPYFVLPAIMMITMLIQVKLNPTPPDPIQAKVSMYMPFIFGVMFFFFPAGLVLYWVVNNVLSIAQQWQITRMVDRGGKAANDAKA